MLLGINALNHDASVCLLDRDNILFAAHAERYSRIKNDCNINQMLLDDCFKYGDPDKIVWFENPLLKATRRLYSGQKPYFSDVKKYLKQFNLNHLPMETVHHHAGHAAMGYYSSKFNDASILVIDAIGEWNTISIWSGEYDCLTCELTVNYPHSMGLFYSAATQAVGLKPNEEEYIFMGMAAYGKPIHADRLKNDLFKQWYPPNIQLKYNLHQGMKHYLSQDFHDVDFAASVQKIFEDYMIKTAEFIFENFASQNLIIVGGSALNCVANDKISQLNLFESVWVPPNPGDAGLSLGAAAYLQEQAVNFDHAYLGHDINRTVDVKSLVAALAAGNIIGVANGRAEWGPRALGNRSLLADPRNEKIKNQVNEVKHRQKFRPFAPVVLEEHADKYFAVNKNINYEYMQFAARCLYPQQFPAIVHVDNSSRVQTVPKNSVSVIRQILECWYETTSCPMLLNTSLNIKGQPLVNSILDAKDFEHKYSIPVF